MKTRKTTGLNKSETCDFKRVISAETSSNEFMINKYYERGARNNEGTENDFKILALSFL